MAYPVLFYRAWTSIDLGASSTAAIGLLFVPFVAAVEAVPWAGVGYAIGSIVRAWQTRARRDITIAAIGVVASLSWLECCPVSDGSPARSAGSKPATGLHEALQLAIEIADGGCEGHRHDLGRHAAFLEHLD